jgi:nicotinate-nucleotide adenylyltransferase
MVRQVVAAGTSAAEGATARGTGRQPTAAAPGEVSQSSADGERCSPPRAGESVGLLGGTFNPIHYAHLRLAETAREALGLDRIFFVPAAVQPLKDAALVATAEHRLQMVRLAIAGHPGFGVLDLELRRAGPSYTVDTLAALRREWGEQCPLWFLMGSDSLAALEQWHEPARLLGLTNIAVAARGAARGLQLCDWLAPALCADYQRAGVDELRWRHRSGRELRWFELEPLEIASSEIRTLLRAGRSARYLVPDPVLAYAREHRLYGEDS